MSNELPEQSNAELDEAARELQAHLQRLVHLKKRGDLYLSLIVAVVILAYPCLLLSIALHLSTRLLDVLLASQIVMLGLLFQMHSQQNRLIAMMNRLDDVNFIGTLIDAISLNQRSTVRGLMPPLTRLLNRVQASQDHLLTPNRRRKLYAMLRYGNRWRLEVQNEDLLVAICKALEQIGDKDAIQHVKYAAMDSRNEKVRETADQCLDFLYQHASEQSVSDTLLRASDANTAAPETLLRAAAARPDAQPGLLLRANAAPDERNA